MAKRLIENTKTTHSFIATDFPKFSQLQFKGSKRYSNICSKSQTDNKCLSVQFASHSSGSFKEVNFFPDSDYLKYNITLMRTFQLSLM